MAGTADLQLAVVNAISSLRHHSGVVQPNVDVSVEAQNRLVMVTVVGFLGADELRDIEARRVAAVKSLGGDLRDHCTLFEVTRCSVLPRDLSDHATRMLARSVLPARRLAFATGSALARMQLGRFHARPNLALFQDVQSAREWLLEEVPRLAAGAPRAA